MKRMAVMKDMALAGKGAVHKWAEQAGFSSLSGNLLSTYCV
jgi:hypothetical protein